MSESTFFRIVGMDIHPKCLRNVKGSKRWVKEVGENVRLASGTRVSLSRPQFFGKWSVTISGDSVVPPPFAHLRFADVLTIDFPHAQSISGKVARADLDMAPADDRIWYFGVKDGILGPRQFSAADITMTMWIPRMTIMLDQLSTDYDDTRGTFAWNIEAEIV